ncbi:MAG: hypothetical protein K9K79_00015 [Desulfohalobiaceae bacterium]|nr:hypothetical protein [Desulfohalobiaceae bacterium]
MAGKNPIYVWVNQERYAELEKAGLAHHTEERLAGLKVLVVYADDEQAKTFVDKFGAKHDTSTTGSIELLPKEVKHRLYDKVVEKQSLDVVSDVLKEFS